MAGSEAGLNANVHGSWPTFLTWGTKSTILKTVSSLTTSRIIDLSQRSSKDIPKLRLNLWWSRDPKGNGYRNSRFELCVKYSPACRRNEVRPQIRRTKHVYC